MPTRPFDDGLSQTAFAFRSQPLLFSALFCFPSGTDFPNQLDLGTPLHRTEGLFESWYASDLSKFSPFFPVPPMPAPPKFYACASCQGESWPGFVRPGVIGFYWQDPGNPFLVCLPSPKLSHGLQVLLRWLVLTLRSLLFPFTFLPGGSFSARPVFVSRPVVTVSPKSQIFVPP